MHGTARIVGTTGTRVTPPRRPRVLPPQCHSGACVAVGATSAQHGPAVNTAAPGHAEEDGRAPWSTRCTECKAAARAPYDTLPYTRKRGARARQPGRW
jgi:hypothetical protein